MRKLVLVRHGETEWNSDNRVQGSVDIPLSDRGRDQAREVSWALLDRGFNFDAVFCSDLSRASETARIIAESLRIDHVEQDSLLRELHCGNWEGEPFHHLKDNHPEDFESWLTNPEARIPGGESLSDVRNRAAAFFEKHREELDSLEEVLVVAHGLYNRMVLSALTGIDPQKCRFFAQDNAAFDLIEFRNGQVWCTAWNLLK